MYTGNGETKVFPLPDGHNGRSVFLCSPTGTWVRLKEGTAYRVENGNVVLTTPRPPQAGWTVAFEEPEGTPLRKGECVVVYSDGTMKELSEDPWELLNAARAEREASRKMMAATQREQACAVAEIRAMADEAKEVLKSRLLNYDSRAEAAIAAAVKASADETATAINRNILEIRNKHREVRDVREALEAIHLETLEAAKNAALEAAAAVKNELAEPIEKVFEAYERTRKMHAETQEMRDHARQSATAAGMDVARQFTARAEGLLEEIRSVKGAMNNEVKSLIDAAKREIGSMAEQAAVAKDEAIRAARRVGELDRHVRTAEREIATREEKVRVMTERAVESDMAMRESLGKLRRDLRNPKEDE